MPDRCIWKQRRRKGGGTSPPRNVVLIISYIMINSRHIMNTTGGGGNIGRQLPVGSQFGLWASPFAGEWVADGGWAGRTSRQASTDTGTAGSCVPSWNILSKYPCMSLSRCSRNQLSVRWPSKWQWEQKCDEGHIDKGGTPGKDLMWPCTLRKVCRTKFCPLEVFATMPKC